MLRVVFRKKAFLFLLLVLITKASYAFVYSSKDQVLKQVFGDDYTFESKVIKLTDQKREIIEKRLGYPLKEESFTFYIVDESYATVVSDHNKYGVNQILVIITNQGIVRLVSVLESTDHKAVKVSQKRFLRQFKGKSSLDLKCLGGGVQAVTGATVSSNSALKAVKKALIVWEEAF